MRNCVICHQELTNTFSEKKQRNNIFLVFTNIYKLKVQNCFCLLPFCYSSSHAYLAALVSQDFGPTIFRLVFYKVVSPGPPQRGSRPPDTVSVETFCVRDVLADILPYKDGRCIGHRYRVRTPVLIFFTVFDLRRGPFLSGGLPATGPVKRFLVRLASIQSFVFVGRSPICRRT